MKQKKEGKYLNVISMLLPVIGLIILSPKIYPFFYETLGIWRRYILPPILLLSFYILVKRKDRLIKLIKTNPFFFIFIGYMGISFFWSEKSLINFLYPYSIYVVTFILVLAALMNKNTKKTSVFIIEAYAILFLILSFVFINFVEPVDETSMVMGIEKHKQDLGIVCVVIGVYLFNRLISSKNLKTLFYLILFLVNLKLLLLSNSVNARIVLPAGIIMILFLKNTNFLKHLSTRARYITLIVFFMLLFALPSAIMLLNSYNIENRTISKVLQSLGKDTTFTGRFYIWRFALEKMERPVFGYGMYNFWTERRMQELWESTRLGINPETNLHSHNAFLDVFVNLGLIGLSLLLINLFIAYKKIFNLIKLDYDTGVLWLVLLTAILFATILESGEHLFLGLTGFIVIFVINMPKSHPNFNLTKTK